MSPKAAFCLRVPGIVACARFRQLLCRHTTRKHCSPMACLPALHLHPAISCNYIYVNLCVTQVGLGRRNAADRTLLVCCWSRGIRQLRRRTALTVWLQGHWLQQAHGPPAPRHARPPQISNNYLLPGPKSAPVPAHCEHCTETHAAHTHAVRPTCL